MKAIQGDLFGAMEDNSHLTLNDVEYSTEGLIDVDLDEIKYEVPDVIEELNLPDTRKQDYSQMYEVGVQPSSLSANDTTAGSVPTIEYSIEPDEFGDIPF